MATKQIIRPHGSDTGRSPLATALLHDDADALANMIASGEGGLSVRFNDYAGRPLLYLAAAAGAARCIQLMADSGASPNECALQHAQTSHRTPLHVAAAGKHFKAVELLLSLGANPRIPSFAGQTVISALIGSSNPILDESVLVQASHWVQIIEKLAKAGCPINQVDRDGDTALSLALSREFPIQIVEALLKAGANPQVVSSVGRQPLHRNREGSASPLVNLLVDYGASLDGRDRDGCTPLFYAQDKGMLRTMISAGADLDSVDIHGRTLLKYLLQQYSDDRAEFLLASGADPAIADHLGETPLHGLVRRLDSTADEREVERAVRLVGLLVGAGCPVDARDAVGYTALMGASLKHLPAPFVEALLEHGANPNLADAFGTTPLHHERTAADQPLIGLLAKHGADPNLRDNLGRTPLFYMHTLDELQAMVDAGGDLHCADRDGQTILHYQMEAGVGGTSGEPILLYLLASGLDPRQPNNAGVTPLDTLDAAFNQDHPTVKSVRLAIAARDAKEAMLNAATARTRGPRP